MEDQEDKKIIIKKGNPRLPKKDASGKIISRAPILNRIVKKANDKLEKKYPLNLDRMVVGVAANHAATKIGKYFKGVHSKDEKTELYNKIHDKTHNSPIFQGDHGAARDTTNRRYLRAIKGKQFRRGLIRKASAIGVPGALYVGGKIIKSALTKTPTLENIILIEQLNNFKFYKLLNG